MSQQSETQQKQVQKEEEVIIQESQSASFFSLFRFATGYDLFLMFIGVIGAVANGAAFPVFAMIFGDMADAFGPGTTPDKVVEKAGFQAMLFAVVGGGSFVMSFLMMATWMTTGERQAIRYRKEYFSALLKQEVGWYDTINPNTLATKVASETFAVQGAIGEKVPTFIMTITMTLGGFVVAYIRGWLMSIVCTAALPVMAISTFCFAWVIQNGMQQQDNAYGIAGGQAEQAINAIKTVQYLTGEEFELNKYASVLKGAFNTAVRYGFYTGFGIGLVFLTCFLDYALGFYYGSVLIQEKAWNHVYDRPYTTGDVLTIFFAIMIGGFSLGQATPCIENFAKGKIAGFKIFEVLDRKPLIEIDKGGEIIENVKGEFQLQNVNFSYPNNSERQILQNINLVIEANKKTALVGQSGSGKSTIFQLIERFYDCTSGRLTLDGKDYQNIDLKWLRSQIGYVGQQPVLFATSIKENMLFANKNASEEEMIEALKKANAWEFISALPEQLNTYVGTGGNQLSGGQKQRICIARAILKNPQILILDEATSALDAKNQGEIQQTLDYVSEGRTTIVIAHRLSTVMNSDKLVLIGEGEIIQQGSHEELLQLKGFYHSLIKKQLEHQNKASTDENPEKGKAIVPMAVAMDGAEKESNEVDDIYGEEHEGLPEVQAEEIFGSKIKYPKDVFKPTTSKIMDKNPKVQKIELTEISAKEKPQNKNIERELPNLAQSESNEKYSPNVVNLANVDIEIANQKQNVDEEQKKKQEDEVEIIESEEEEFINQNKLTPEQQKRLDQLNDSNLNRLFLMNKPERPWLFAGVFWALLNGIPFPAIGLVMARMIQTLADPTKSDFREKSDLLSLLFLLLGVAVLLTNTFEFYFFTRVGEGLTYRIRQDCFQKITSMPIQWFDKPQNNPGSLAARLASDCSLINGLTSTIVGIQISNTSSLIVGTIIAFVSSWQVTLVSLGCTPLMMIAGQMQAKFVQGFSEATDDAYKDSGNLIYQAVTNIRTVASFANQEFLMTSLENKLQTPASQIVGKAIISGLCFGFSQMTMFIVYAITFYCGAIFYREGWVTPGDMFASIFSLMNASFGAGNNSQFMGDIGAGKNAARNIFKLLDQKDEYQLQDDYLKKNNLEKVKKQIKGHIKFENVKFRYPSRKKYIFENLNIEINPGQKVAFVGESGNGKSTIIQLLLRYYDIVEGQILIDGVDIRQYDIRYLREQLGVVSQEPVLFNGTIRDNIIYNCPDVTDEMMIQAAKQANALGFIEQNQFVEIQNNNSPTKAVADQAKLENKDKQPGDDLEKQKLNKKDSQNKDNQKKQEDNNGYGFEKKVGPKGSQISGGQKQRIAIARILLKNPKIMILDEATSALDAENQALVQESLDRIMKGKTSVVVAHRISTIQDSDQINVVEKGQIKEKGKYDELLQIPNSTFSILNQVQSKH